MKELLASAWKGLTADLTPEEQRAFNRIAFKIGWRGLIIGHILYACGWLVALGIGPGFARADEVDKKIATSVQPLIEEQRSQKQLLTQLSRQINEQLANGLASEIRYLVAKKCSEQGGGEKERIQKEIDLKQVEYQALRGNRYDYGCGDV